VAVTFMAIGCVYGSCGCVGICHEGCNRKVYEYGNLSEGGLWVCGGDNQAGCGHNGCDYGVCDYGSCGRQACSYCDLVPMGCMAVVPISLGCGYGYCGYWGYGRCGYGGIAIRAIAMRGIAMRAISIRAIAMRPVAMRDIAIWL
jgi:hypothetical protein